MKNIFLVQNGMPWDDDWCSSRPNHPICSGEVEPGAPIDDIKFQIILVLLTIITIVLMHYFKQRKKI